MVKRLRKRPRDILQRAKMIGDIAIGVLSDCIEDGKDEAAVSMGRRGGKAKAKRMTPEQRSALGRKMALARWKKRP